jgi:uncharacterized membrane protein YkoI
MENAEMKYFNTIRTLAMIAVMPSLVQGAMAYKGEKLAKTAKITMEQATEIALKARPGNITDKELEREKGGSGLRYTFDVLSKELTYEVGVDAQTGTVLENTREGAHSD